LEGIIEFDKLFARLDRQSRLRQLKLKPWIDVGPHPAEGDYVQRPVRKRAAGDNSRLVIMLKLRGVLVAYGEDAKERDPVGMLWPPLDDLLCSLDVETVQPRIKDFGVS
jgi:hypothetical protein